MLKSPSQDASTKSDFKRSISENDPSEPLFLDLGCCVGQDVRSLAYAGVSGSRLIGVELEPAFVEIGYKLFRDREKLTARFLIGDILTLEESPPSPLTAINESQPDPFSPSKGHVLSPFVARISVIWVSAFLHLWDLQGQENVCRKILTLLHDEPGVRVLGRQVGNKTPAEIKHVTNKGGLMYQHNPESFKGMWARVLGHKGEIEATGSLESTSHGRWEVSAWFEEDKPAQAQQQRTDGQSDSDWLTKVAAESAGISVADAKKAKLADETGDKDSRTYFLVWEAERVG